MVVAPATIQADIVQDMLGNWSGPAAVYDGRVKIADATVTSRVVRYGKRGMKSTNTVRIPGEPVTTSIGWMHDNGTVLGVVRQRGRTLGILDGTWRIKGNEIISSARVSSLLGDYRQNSKTIRVNRNRFDTRGTTSLGLSVRGSLNRTR
jgi:hypothetical protein